MRTTYLRLFFIPAFSIALLAPSLESQNCVGGTVTSPCIPDTASDTEVIGVSEIIAPYNDTINGYSATELGATVAFWYDAGEDSYI